MGPLLEFKDPRFLSWPNLRVVLAIGLVAGIVAGCWDAAWHGWAGVNVLGMILRAAWIPIVCIGLHLWFRPKRQASD